MLRNNQKENKETSYMSKNKKKSSRPKNNNNNLNPQKISDNEKSSKKAIVLGMEKRTGKSWVLFLIPVLIIAGISAYILMQDNDKIEHPQTQVSTDNTFGQITYPIELFQDGKSHHFEYKAGDISIKYFILKSTDGIIRAAFDACDVCWPSGKGYYQNGDDMVCRNCGRRFASVLINVVTGGCNPAPLMQTIAGDKLVLQVKDLLEGKPYFNLTGRI